MKPTRIVPNQPIIFFLSDLFDVKGEICPTQVDSIIKKKKKKAFAADAVVRDADVLFEKGGNDASR